MYAILEIGSNAIKGLVYNENLINAHKIYQIKYINNIDISSVDIIKNNYSFFQNINSLINIFKNFNFIKLFSMFLFRFFILFLFSIFCGD